MKSGKARSQWQIVIDHTSFAISHVLSAAVQRETKLHQPWSSFDVGNVYAEGLGCARPFGAWREVAATDSRRAGR